MTSNQIDESPHALQFNMIPHNISFEGIDGGFDKKKTIDIDLWEHAKMDDQMLVYDQCCDNQMETYIPDTCEIMMEIETIPHKKYFGSINSLENILLNMQTQDIGSSVISLIRSEETPSISGCIFPQSESNLIDYNKKLIRKSKTQKIQGKNRYPDIFLPRFKWAIKRMLEKKFPNKKFRMKDLNRLPGMNKPSMSNMIDLLEIKNLFSTGVPSKNLSEQFTSSDDILLDALFPLQTSSGTFRKKRIEKESTTDFLRFFSSYEIISKLVDRENVPRHDLTFQNCRHYNLVTNIRYNPFDIEN